MKLIKTKTRFVKSLSALSLVAALVLNPLAVATQAANEISRLVPFQGRLHGTDNKAVADGVYDITFNVYDTATGGTPAWTESHSQVSIIHGYVNILLGAINPMHETNYAEVTGTPAYDESKNHVDFTKKKFLGISIDGGVEMFPRSQLVPSFHAYTANHADHATQADNADNLGNKAASSYAQLSHVSSEDIILNNRITAVSNGLDTDVTSASSRITTLESRFTGTKANNADTLDGLNYDDFAVLNVNGRAANAELLDNHDSTYFATDSRMTAVEAKFNSGKANDAVLFDGLDSSKYARTDTTETFNSNVTFGSDIYVNGEDIFLGNDGGGDTGIHFYDDNSNDQRTLQWDDSYNHFRMELDDETFVPVMGGLQQKWSGSSQTVPGSFGTGFYLIQIYGGGLYYTTTGLITNLGVNSRFGFGSSAEITYTGSSSTWSSSWGNITKIYKFGMPL